LSWAKQGAFAKSIDDYCNCISKFPEHLKAYNHLIWTVATKAFAGRKNWEAEALRYVDLLLAIQRIANYLL
jgi:hypothetical protein